MNQTGRQKANTVWIELPADHFDLEKTFECGQCFRWKKIDLPITSDPASSHHGNPVIHAYGGIASGKGLVLYQTERDILMETTHQDFEGFWSHYFDLMTDYEAIEKRLGGLDPVMADAAEFGRGIRILRQDPWEMLITFILSGNNNIPRIKGTIEKLSEWYGEKMTLHEGSTVSPMWAFPTPSALAALDPEAFRKAGAGYRDRYLHESAQRVASGTADLDAWTALDDHELRKALISLPGVGEKVADCIMLFSYGRMSAFPVDTWVKRMMHQAYFDHEAGLKEIGDFARQHFGGFAGYAQQYLFYWIRNRKMEAYVK